MTFQCRVDNGPFCLQDKSLLRDTGTDTPHLSLGSSLIIFSSFYFSVPWSKMSILIKINNGQPMPLMWYTFILLFFKILALENYCQNIDDWTQAILTSVKWVYD